MRLLENDPKRVIFTSNFGTGKTTLLKAKVKKLLAAKAPKSEEKNEEKSEESDKTKKLKKSTKIFYAIFSNLGDTLLTHSVRKEFENMGDYLEVITMNGNPFYFVFISFGLMSRFLFISVLFFFV